MHRDSYLQMDDDTLLHACSVQGFQGSGPGGQHRNKTNTGVLLRLASFNLEIRCCEERSALRNRELALRRMRLALALHCRDVPPPIPSFAFPGSNGHIQPANPGYASFIADCLDRLQLAGGEVASVARVWGLSTSALVRLFFADKAVLEAVQRMRDHFGKPSLKK